MDKEPDYWLSTEFWKINFCIRKCYLFCPFKIRFMENIMSLKIKTVHADTFLKGLRTLRQPAQIPNQIPNPGDKMLLKNWRQSYENPNISYPVKLKGCIQWRTQTHVITLIIYLTDTKISIFLSSLSKQSHHKRFRVSVSKIHMTSSLSHLKTEQIE